MKYAQTILFAVTGMSPAVLTETVWALAHDKPALIPDRVVVLTTAAGRARIVAELFGPDNVWDRLRTAILSPSCRRPRSSVFRLPSSVLLRFGTTGDDIRVFANRDPATGRSTELDDIRTPDDNAAAADFILETLRAFAENPDTRVIASLAGGRKTMGALLYACMTLIGRETDRLTHVLVNAPYEDARLAPRFYFPGCAGTTPPPSWNPPPRIELADIPFVPLRNRFRELAAMPGSFRSLILRFSADLKSASVRPARVALDPARRCVTVDGASATLGQRAFDVLRFLLDVNARGVVPEAQKDAVEPLKAFLGGAAWLQSADDIKRQLSDIRRALTAAGIAWQPGARAFCLRLPAFELAQDR